METGLPTIVATPDREIAEVIRGEGGEVCLTGDHPSGSDRVWEAVRDLGHEVVINLQGDLPFIKPEHIVLSSRALSSSRPNDVGTLAFKDRMVRIVEKPSNFWRVEVDRHIGVYAYTKAALHRFSLCIPDSVELEEGLEQRRFRRLNFKIGVEFIDEFPPCVDTVEDGKRIENGYHGTH
jgi:3-deoxy-manno-octulosonate cytidylyltransferase (CMP-KDO synthetase)